MWTSSPLPFSSWRPPHRAVGVAEDALVGGPPIHALRVVAVEVHLVKVGGELPVRYLDQDLVRVLGELVEEPNAEHVPIAKELGLVLAVGTVEIDFFAEPAGRSPPGADVELLPSDDEEALVVQPDDGAGLDVGGPEADGLRREVRRPPHGDVRRRVDVRQGQGHDPLAVGTDVHAVDHRVVDPGAHRDAFGRRGQPGREAQGRPRRAG